MLPNIRIGNVTYDIVQMKDYYRKEPYYKIEKEKVIVYNSTSTMATNSLLETAILEILRKNK